MALLKLGLSYSDIVDMPEAEGDALIMAYDDIINPKKPKKAIVRRKKK